MGVLEREYMRRDVDEDCETFRPLWSVTEEQLEKLATTIDEMTMPAAALMPYGDLSPGGSYGRTVIAELYTQLRGDAYGTPAQCEREAKRKAISYAILAWLRAAGGLVDDEG